MRSLVVLVGFIWLAAGSAAPAATTEAEFKAAFAAAEAAENDAAKLKNCWTTAEQVLAAAKKAAAAGDFDTATVEARQAEALAKASIAQAKEQEEAWRAAVIH